MSAVVFRRNGWRARSHPAYWAFVTHRLSGLLLTAFLPVHFLVLAQALNGPAALDSVLRWTEQPLVRFVEWTVVALLAIHLIGGLRLLAIEWLPRHGWRNSRRSLAVGAVLLVALGFALALSPEST
mgnify:CR=1 FL=1